MSHFSVYIRRFQPLLKSDLLRIFELSEQAPNLVVAIVQLCFDPETAYNSSTNNHPALNPFSYWERFLWINKYILANNLKSIRITPLPWYQYQLRESELDTKRRLWLPDRFSTYLPENAVFYLEDDDPDLIYYLQSEVSLSQINVLIPHNKETPSYMAVQRMIYKDKNWKNWVADETINDINQAGKVRIKSMWDSDKSLEIIQTQLKGDKIMDENSASKVVASLLDLHKEINSREFLEKFPNESKELSDLIINQSSEIKTILSELQRLEKNDIYGKDPSFAQDRFTLTKRLQGLTTGLEVNFIPQVTNKLKLIATQA